MMYRLYDWNGIVMLVLMLVSVFSLFYCDRNVGVSCVRDLVYIMCTHVITDKRRVG